MPSEDSPRVFSLPFLLLGSGPLRHPLELPAQEKEVTQFHSSESCFLKYFDEKGGENDWITG